MASTPPLFNLALVLVCVVASVDASAEGPHISLRHPFIRVSAEELVATAPSENLFLCPMNVTDGIDLSSWPSEEVTIDGTLCMDYDELMEVDKRGDFLKCLTEVTNATTHALDMLGIDATIIHGTLLGWQRHDKSLIPWDADADLTIMQSHCQQAFKKHATEQHKNMAALIKNNLPTDSYYRVAGIVFGVGSEFRPDEWTGCDAQEFRIIHDYKDVTCHADIFQLLQSNYPGGEECASCPGYDEGLVTVCREAGNSCALYDDYFPMKWDKQDGGDVKIPNRAIAALESNFGSLSWKLLNLKKVPRNHEFATSMLVVGQSLMSNETALPSSANLRGPQSVLAEVDSSVMALRDRFTNNRDVMTAVKISAVNWPQASDVAAVSHVDTHTVSLIIGMVCFLLIFFVVYSFFNRIRVDVSSAGESPTDSANSLLNLVDVIKRE
ncbi:hypothetical protein FOZ62_032460 [Perkinsus olseni]|uniref:LicD/FKTN/FKRP nucleotidyltransferase domain-containing protein n=1 Tax=Perkinsus olseni TaxID=32597 RepID=A0A7J6R0J4_PEROL|nr:hypothetical protein FOZ62_032460 [Perkinsus olseni]